MSYERLQIFFQKKEKNGSAPLFIRRSKNKTVHVAIFSDFFSNIPDNMFCTNAMYAEFKETLINTVDVFNAREKVVVELYETNPSDEDLRDVALIGFRNYIRACRSKLKRQYIVQMIQLGIFALLSILLMYITYEIFYDMIPEWVSACLTNVSSVLLWQFVGFWAFEYVARKREVDQLKQIESIEFNFKLWE